MLGRDLALCPTSSGGDRGRTILCALCGAAMVPNVLFSPVIARFGTTGAGGEAAGETSRSPTSALRSGVRGLAHHLEVCVGIALQSLALLSTSMAAVLMNAVVTSENALRGGGITFGGFSAMDAFVAEELVNAVVISENGWRRGWPTTAASGGEFSSALCKPCCESVHKGSEVVWHS
jgi:hypothetical protein